MTSDTNAVAQTLRALHVPGSPLLLTNIWDVASLKAVLALNDDDGGGSGARLVKAVATASWAMAAAEGIDDEELSLEQNLAVVARIAPLCRAAGLPLTCDLQDGYGTRVAEAVTAVVGMGAAGANIEDSIPAAGFGRGLGGSLYALDEQVARLRRGLAAAAAAGCPDFVLNARCDVFCLDDDGSLDEAARVREAVARGRAYLDAGATTVFYWGGPRQRLSRESLQALVGALDGRVAVLLAAHPGGPTAAALAELGVARISIGPTLFRVAMAAVRRAAAAVLAEGTMPAL